MGAYLSQPSTVKTSANGGNTSMSYGFSAMQGWRISMEVRTPCAIKTFKIFLVAFVTTWRNCYTDVGFT